MKELTNFEFSPSFQPGDAEVKFTLKPLSQKSQYELLTTMVSVGDAYKPSWEGIKIAAKHVAGWEGIEPAFSREAIRSVLNSDTPDPRWSIWLFQIAETLYAKSFLSEEVEKKS